MDWALARSRQLVEVAGTCVILQLYKNASLVRNSFSGSRKGRLFG